MTRRLWQPAALLVLLLAGPADGQRIAPRDAFVEALGRFSLALGGTVGDEREIIRAALDAMERALQAWDAQIRTYESAMSAEIGAADRQLAARMRMALGAVYLDRQRVDAALKELLTARSLDPDRPDVHALLGAVHAQLTADRAAALEAVRKAASLDPANPLRSYLVARHFAADSKLEESRTAARAFLDGGPLRQALEKRMSLSSPFIRLGLLPEAADVEPFFPPVRYSTGFEYLAQGDYHRAIVAFRDATASDPLVVDDGPHREAMNRAARSIREGALPAAIAQLTQAVSLAPDRPEPLRLLGRAYAINDQHEEAIAAGRRAVTLDPRDERHRLTLVQTLVDAGRFEEAHGELGETLAVLPSSGRARYALARLYQREGKLAEALTEFERAAAFKPLLGLNGIYHIIGELHARQQRLDRARDAYGQRLDLHPNDPDAHYDLADIYLRLGRHDDALSELAVVLLLDPANAKAATMMAQAHLRDGDYVAAAAASGRAVEIDMTLTEAHYVLGTALLRLKRVDEGNRELEIYRRLEAEAAAVRARLLEIEALRRDAAVSAATGDDARTVASLRKVLELESSYRSRLELGVALLDAGQAAEALEHLTAAARHDDARYEVHRYLAAAYAALGRAAESQREHATFERIRQEDLKRRSTR
jgi:tetratricopeptide (TPR) repeat protein